MTDDTLQRIAERLAELVIATLPELERFIGPETISDAAAALAADEGLRGIVATQERALRLVAGWREVIAEIADLNASDVLCRAMIASLDQIDRWMKDALAALDLAAGGEHDRT